MAQLVLIDTGTIRLKDGVAINAIGDLVSIHDDDVALTGPGYVNFKIVKVPGTAEEVRQRLDANLPEVKQAYKTNAPAGKFGFDRPEEIEVWNDNGVPIYKTYTVPHNPNQTPDELKDHIERAIKDDLSRASEADAVVLSVKTAVESIDTAKLTAKEVS